MVGLSNLPVAITDAGPFCLSVLSFQQNEFTESEEFPLAVKPAAAWLDAKLKVTIVQTERELVDVWHRANRSQKPNLLMTTVAKVQRLADRAHTSSIASGVLAGLK